MYTELMPFACVHMCTHATTISFDVCEFTVGYKIDTDVHLQVCVTGESERTPLVILTMSQLTILEDS